MRVTIDEAGRLVIPKRIRERLALKGGEVLEVEELDGVVEIRRVPLSDELVEVGGILTFREGTGLTTPEEVREAIERAREREL